MTCAEVFARLDDFLDRELRAEEATEVEAHLRRCAQCLREHDFERAVLEEIGRKLRRITPPAGLWARTCESLPG